MYLLIITAAVLVAMLAFLLVTDQKLLRQQGRHARPDFRSGSALVTATLQPAPTPRG